MAILKLPKIKIPKMNKALLLSIGIIAFLGVVAGAINITRKPSPSELESSQDAATEQVEQANPGQANQQPNVAGSSKEIKSPPEPIETFGTVKKVISGDVIELANGKKVKYIGIKAPGTKEINGTGECIGEESTAKNRELVEGKKIRMVKDVRNSDIYGRLLRYVYVDDTFINEMLVKEGFAKAVTTPPDVEHQEALNNAAADAQEQRWGIWNEECASIVDESAAEEEGDKEKDEDSDSEESGEDAETTDETNDAQEGETNANTEEPSPSPEGI